MSAENCIDTTRCPCPCLPKVTLEQAVVDLVESIALQESALSHILCAETQKPREDKKRVQNDVDNAAQRHACGGGQRAAAGTEKVG